MSNHAMHLCLALMFVAMLKTPLVYCDYYSMLDEWQEEEWADPGDMLRYDTNTKTMAKEKPKVQPRREIPKIDDHGMEKFPATPPSCGQPESHFYKRFIRSLLAHIKSELHLYESLEEMQFDVLIKLSESEMAMLKSYVSPQSKVAIQDVDEILTHLIKHVRLYRETTEYAGTVTWFDRLLKTAQDKFEVISATVAGLLVILIFRQLSPARAFVLGLVLLFVAGTVYEGINMYQKLEAEKFAEQHKLAQVPEHCNPGSVNFFRRLGWSLQVNLLGMDDPCKKYYELLMVDTRYKINPLEVTTAALGKVVEAMARFGGNSFGLFYSKALMHFNWLEKILFVIVMTIVSIAAVMYMGPALVFSIPSLMRGMRRTYVREMVEDIPQGQHRPPLPPGGVLAQRTPPSVAVEPCSKCGNHQPVKVPVRSSPNRITIKSGNKCISIEDIESPETHGGSDAKSSEENALEPSSATAIKDLK